MIEKIASIIVEILLVGGGSIVILFGFIKWFGQKWFANQFDESLEEFKREQSEILEHYRYQINSQFNRIVKIHDKEFEVLPKAWHLLNDSYGHLMSIANLFQQWPDLNRYSPEQLDSFLEKCELQDFQKEELRLQNDKIEYYKTAAYWIRLNIARNKFNEFRSYLQYNKIFLSRDLFDLFHQIEVVMIEAEAELENPENEDNPWRGTSRAYKKLTENENELLGQIESSVQKRLHFDKA